MGPIGSFRDQLAALWRKAWLIALVIAAGVPLAVAFALSKPRIYEATSVIQIEAPEITVTTTGQTQGVTADAQLDLIIQNLMARDNIAALADRFGLFPEAGSPIVRVALVRQAITATKLVDPAQAWRPDVQPSGLSITVRLGDADAAAQVANAAVDQIVAEARARSEGRTERTLAFLVSEEARVSGEIAGIEGRIAAFRATNVDSLPEGLTAQRDRLNRLSEQQLSLEQSRIELLGEQGRMRAEDVAAQDQLLSSQIALVTQDIAGIQAALAAAPEVERELSAMTRTLDQLEAELTVLTQQRTAAAMEQTLASQEQSQHFEVLETAVVPEYPVSASRKKVALAGIAAVVIAALGLALGLEMLHPAIRTAAQMERQLGVQPVIVVPRLRTRRGRIGRRIGLVAGLAALAALAAAALRWGGQIVAGLAGLAQRQAAPVRVAVSPRRRQ